MALSRSKQDGKYHLELMAAKQQSMHEANASRICYSANVQPATAADARTVATSDRFLCRSCACQITAGALVMLAIVRMWPLRQMGYAS